MAIFNAHNIAITLNTLNDRHNLSIYLSRDVIERRMHGQLEVMTHDDDDDSKERPQCNADKICRENVQITIKSF